ncbi:MAG: cold shock domain-containing protein [Elusimicrobia bacterium]|nr:cold shock domain-containing protein [Elusimicrobiota bacterium]
MPGTASPNRVKGTVKWWNDAKGFGFLTTEKGEDVFVRFYATDDNSKTLAEGEAVEFEVGRGPKGLHAIQVVRLSSPSPEPSNPSPSKPRANFTPTLFNSMLGSAIGLVAILILSAVFPSLRVWPTLAVVLGSVSGGLFAAGIAYGASSKSESVFTAVREEWPLFVMGGVVGAFIGNALAVASATSLAFLPFLGMAGMPGSSKPNPTPSVPATSSGEEISAKDATLLATLAQNADLAQNEVILEVRRLEKHISIEQFVRSLEKAYGYVQGKLPLPPSGVRGYILRGTVPFKSIIKMVKDERFILKRMMVPGETPESDEVSRKALEGARQLGLSQPLVGLHDERFRDPDQLLLEGWNRTVRYDNWVHYDFVVQRDGDKVLVQAIVYHRNTPSQKTITTFWVQDGHRHSERLTRYPNRETVRYIDESRVFNNDWE